MNKLFLSLSLISLSILGSESVREQLEQPTKAVFIDFAGDFHLIDNGKAHKVDKIWVDPLLQKLKTPEQIESFNEHCYIKPVLMSDNTYKLIALGRLYGGGPVSATACYWIAKSLCWAVVTAGVSAGVVAGGAAIVGTGGAATPAVAMTAKAVAIGVGLAAKLGLASGAGTAILATGITAAGGGAMAATATAGGVSAAGGAVGLVAAIETVSVVAGALGGLLPLP